MGQIEEMTSYQTVSEVRSCEITEKKSRFIADAGPVETEQEAAAFIDGIKKRHRDASHHCYAYVIGNNAGTVRCSDDGEPNGTAGRPMLEVLVKEGLCNVVVVVTRYFGGTLLGTGGLARAYTQAAKAGIEACSIVRMRGGIKISIGTNYNDAGKVQYILRKYGLAEYDSEYTEHVVFTVILPIEKSEAVLKDIMEATNAKAALGKAEHLFYVDKRDGV